MVQHVRIGWVLLAARHGSQQLAVIFTHFLADFMHRSVKAIKVSVEVIASDIFVLDLINAPVQITIALSEVSERRNKRGYQRNSNADANADHHF